MRSAAAVPPCKLRLNEALQRRANEPPLVGCYAELAGAMPQDNEMRDAGIENESLR
jgi:hypothetical protein